MSKITEKILKQITDKLNEIREKYEGIFNKPKSLILINLAAITALETIKRSLREKLENKVDVNLSDKTSIKTYLRKDPYSNLILKYADSTITNKLINESILKCQNLTEEDVVSFSKIDFENEIEELQDINDKINEFLGNVQDFISELSKYITLALMIYYIVELTIELFQNTEFPSTFRLKYIQRLTRISLSTIWTSGKEEFNEIKGFLTKIDELLITIGVSSALFIYNKKKTKELSEKQFKEITCPDLLPNIQEEVNIESKPFEINLNCKIEKDKNLIPKKPFNENDNLNCEIQEISEPPFESTLGYDIATKAIIWNKSKEKIKFTVKKENQIDDRTIIGSLGDLSVYSPVIGKVSIIQDGSMILSDISEPSEEYLVASINELNSKYDELNNIKTFLKSWEVRSLYPIMLSKSFFIDTSSNLIGTIKIKYSNMYKQFEKIENEWERIKEDYEKNIKNITKKENVKVHAEKETLYKIKEDVEKEEEKIHKYLIGIKDESIKIARQTQPNSGETEMMEYYFLELGIPLNIIDNPDDLTKEYRIQINEFIRQRYIIDKWKPKTIRKKANDLFDELEKGITTGDWFQKGLDKYNKNKKISDIRNWLQKLAEENKNYQKKKTKYDKLVNKLVYLYEFYLETDKINKDYKKYKEVSRRDQIVKESNYINNFISKLTVRLAALPEEIKELEKRIEDLSLTSNYYLTDIDNEQYRVYTIIDDQIACELPDSREGYDKTKKGFGDIEYWLKWCAGATLMSLPHLSTGFIGPIGPIPFPVVYIPIKPIETRYGVIVLGLTITGIYLFPFAFFINYSEKYVFPALDPTTLIKKEIDALKKELTNKLKTFRSDLLQNYLDKLYNEIEDLEEQLEIINQQITYHKENRPPGGIKNAQLTAEWLKLKAVYKEEQLTIRTKKWEKEKKYDLVKRVKDAGGKIGKNNDPSDAAIIAIEKTEESIDKAFAKLDSLLEKIENIAASVAAPLCLDPYTFSLAASIKRPTSPYIEIKKGLENTTDQTIPEKLVDKFTPTNEDLMKSPKIFDMKAFKIAKFALLDNPISRLAYVKNEPLPSYENLIPFYNLSWANFVTKDFGPEGAKTYGIPGQPTFSVNI